MTVSCPACASPVDPLRAGHVAIFDDRFFYFCDSACRERVAPLGSAATAGEGTRQASPTPTPAGRRAATRATAGRGFPPASAERRTSAEPVAPGPAEPSFEIAASVFADPSTGAIESSSADMAAPPSRLGFREEQESVTAIRTSVIVLGAAIACGVLAIALVLAGVSSTVMVLRYTLCLVGLLGVAIYSLRARREPTDVHPLLLLAPGAAASALAIFTFVGRDLAAEEAATFAGVVVTGTAAAIALVDRARRAVAAERSLIDEVLDCGVKRPAGALEGARDPVRPGEEVSVESGSILGVDGNVIAGEAVVIPWIGASHPVRRREGDAIVAGARLVSGRLRVRATYVGLDRSWARLTLDPRRRGDVHARVALLSRTIAERGGLGAMVIAGFAALVNREPFAQIALSAIAAYAAITTATVASIAAVHVARGVMEGLRQGIAYRTAPDWDRAGDVSIAAFCARGTLLIGEPELADLEPLGRWNETQVLAFAAGAESASNHPVAMAVQRAAVVRHIQPDAVRSPVSQPGLGVTAVASTGEALTVGSRALMLREKISVAIAEQKIAEIEGRGREVLLVALGGRLVGVIGMQDALRPGSRAAVQHLLDAQVEPVLLSGDSRETCEAIGRALDIEHVRPEILPVDRALEIERLSQGGVTVAVIGHPRTDEAALTAADVAVAMPSMGGGPGEWGITLASDDVRHGALAISLARRTKYEARAGLVLALAPGVAFALAVAFGVLPAAYAPLAGFFGAAASALHARATDLARVGASSWGKGADDFRAAELAAHG
ncbi:MAG TPA: HAD-IC family P-type ATPase [Polyangiaceae bacterium]|nr:HAD-IC family P-type ATPase [Polyangiaceae bacterium]